MDRTKNENNNKYIILGLFISLTILFFFLGNDVSENNINEKNEVTQTNNNENEVNKEKTKENEKNSINENNENNKTNLNDMPQNVNVETLKKNINQTKLEYEKYIEEQRQLFIQQSSKIHTFFLILFSSILLIIYLWSGYKIKQREKKLKNKNLNSNQKDNEYKLLINEDEFEEFFYE
jgi:hypothetical protein